MKKTSNEHREFWRDIVYKDGKLDEELVMLELEDFSDMMDRFGTFLCESTGGRMSKLNYTTGAMRSCFEDYVQDRIDEAIKEDREDRETEA
jgi:hypothetical protein